MNKSTACGVCVCVFCRDHNQEETQENSVFLIEATCLTNSVITSVLRTVSSPASFPGTGELSKLDLQTFSYGEILRRPTYVYSVIKPMHVSLEGMLYIVSGTIQLRLDLQSVLDCDNYTWPLHSGFLHMYIESNYCYNNITEQ